MNATADQITIKGIHTIRNYELPKELEERIEALALLREEMDPTEHRRMYQTLFAEMQQYKVHEKTFKNLVVTVGRSVIAQRLANVTTYTGIVNYGALGSSATAASNADTQLGTEVFRKLVASTSYTTNVAFCDFFYTASDTSGTYQEFGTFIDGTASANTGQMFTHFITGGWSKSSSQSMTVSSQYTLS